MEPNPNNELVPKKFGMLALLFVSLSLFALEKILILMLLAYFTILAKGGAKSSFKKHSLDFTMVDQINAITHHTGLGNPGTQTHPRLAYIILGYRPTYTTFSYKQDSSKWVEPKLSRKAKYHLFKKFYILTEHISYSSGRKETSPPR